MRGRAALAAAASDSGGQQWRRDALLREAARRVKSLSRRKLRTAAPLAALVAGGLARQRGRIAAGARHFAAAAAQLERFEMEMHAASARMREGQLGGGAAGDEIAAAAKAKLAGLGAAQPERFAGIFAPL